jgi:hypothetical protein
MPTLGETNIYRVWAAKQSAKGTPATVPTRSFKQVAGTVVAAVDSGTENFSDGTSFGDTTTWLNSITGTGSPGMEGTTDESRGCSGCSTAPKLPSPAPATPRRVSTLWQHSR